MSDAASPVFRLPELLARCLGDPEFACEMLGMLEVSGPGLVEAVRAAADRGDLDAVRRSAHTLKGSAANLAADQLRDVCTRLEYAVRDQEAGLVAELVGRLEAEFARTLAAVGPAQSDLLLRRAA